MHITQIYEESDIESADALFLHFPKTCYFYDDVFSDGEDKEPFNSLRQLCPECFVRDSGAGVHQAKQRSAKAVCCRVCRRFGSAGRRTEYFIRIRCGTIWFNGESLKVFPSGVYPEG